MKISESMPVFIVRDLYTERILIRIKRVVDILCVVSFIKRLQISPNWEYIKRVVVCEQKRHGLQQRQRLRLQSKEEITSSCHSQQDNYQHSDKLELSNVSNALVSSPHQSG